MATKSSPKGWWVNPSDEIKAMIEKRCEESMRTPAQEIVWILREWERGQEAGDRRTSNEELAS